jgi:pimeloyl-ACP methyl ester carboxylesterase
VRRTALLAAAAASSAGLVAARRRAPGAWPELNPREVQVSTTDGLQLHAEVHGPDDAAATVVLAHGYVLSNRLWDQQVRDLLAARPDLRVVTYDHRGHGRSQRSPRDAAHFGALAADLRAVLEQTAPTGPVVLGGHSMGGMTIMAFLEAHHADLAERLAGVALVATSSGGLAELTWGLPAPVAARVRLAIPAVTGQAARREDAGKRPLPQGFLRPILFGRKASAADVRRTFAIMSACSAHTFADFFDAFTTHDRLEALATLRELPVVILAGSVDRLCPLPHSRAMARALPDADLHVYDGAGHMLMLERADEVSARLVELCAVALPAASRRTVAS